MYSGCLAVSIRGVARVNVNGAKLMIEGSIAALLQTR